jgi:hypothetical protein
MEENQPRIQVENAQSVNLSADRNFKKCCKTYLCCCELPKCCCCLCDFVVYLFV